MSELAFNINGEAFDLPATATGWRVRRMRHLDRLCPERGESRPVEDQDPLHGCVST